MLRRVMALALVGAALVGCSKPEPAPVPSADQKRSRALEQNLSVAADSIPLPEVPKMTDMLALKRVYEIRDENPPTITYTRGRDGVLHKFCDSRGFGVPNDVQFTSPTKYVTRGTDRMIAVAQAEPNGLFNSPTQSGPGSWVMCVFPGHPDPAPVYVGWPVATSPFPLPGAQ